MNSKPTNNTIALVCIIVGALMTLLIFFESRMDPGLRMAALVFASNICTAIVAISSLLLTGKDLTKPDAADLPPGTSVHQQSDIKVPSDPLSTLPKS